MAEGWARRLPPPGDMAAAAVLLVAMTAVRLGAERETDAPLAAVLALSAVIAAGVALRRRAPLTAYALGSAGLAAEALWVGPGPLTPVANLIGVYSLGLYATPVRALLGAPLILPGVLAHFAPKDDSSVTQVAVVCVWLLVWGAGRATARRREEMAELLRREAVVAERVRIAREVHDVLGHSVNAMLVQAGAGRLVLDTDPARTRELLMSVERTGRDALTELDHLLGLLRAEDDEDAEPGARTAAGAGAGATAPPGPPNPDPADLARLIRPLADAGMDVRLHIEPETGTLPRAIRLSVHRIVQEALTNALRHGHARSAEVTVRTEPLEPSEPSVRSDRSGRAVLVRIVDGGEGPDPGYRPGRGLRGITERAVAFGGSVSHGPADGGGFALSVELPLP
jgi:signal transduction histidine kinase